VLQDGVVVRREGGGSVSGLDVDLHGFLGGFVGRSVGGKDPIIVGCETGMIGEGWEKNLLYPDRGNIGGEDREIR